MVGHRAHCGVLETNDPAVLVALVTSAVALGSLVDVDELRVGGLRSMLNVVAEALLDAVGARGRDRVDHAIEVDQAELLILAGVLRVGQQGDSCLRSGILNALLHRR